MKNILGMIGLAKRAGALSVGAVACEASIKSRTAKLVIVAVDASDNSRKTVKDSCSYYKIPCLEFSDMENLGRFSGGGEKAVIAVNDENFASALIQKIQGVQGKDR